MTELTEQINKLRDALNKISNAPTGVLHHRSEPPCPGCVKMQDIAKAALKE